MNHQDFLVNKPWPMNVLKTLAEYGYKIETRGPYRGPETVLIWDPSGDSILTTGGTMTHSPASAAALGLEHLANEVRKYDADEHLKHSAPRDPLGDLSRAYGFSTLELLGEA